jgi:hypothetical protein
LKLKFKTPREFLNVLDLQAKQLVLKINANGSQWSQLCHLPPRTFAHTSLLKLKKNRESACALELQPVMSVNKMDVNGITANHQSLFKLHGVKLVPHLLLDSGMKLLANMHAHHLHQLSSLSNSATQLKSTTETTLAFGQLALSYRLLPYAQQDVSGVTELK